MGMVAALNAFQPEALTAYPSGGGRAGRGAAPGAAADRADAGRHVLGGADGRHAPAHGRRLGVEPHFYGTTEALIVAAGRQGQAGMEILKDLVVVEVVDERDPGHGAKFKAKFKLVKRA
jgi:phenylacetate-coenzyme A ligase PaaK-like adenylate-forming protein